MADDISLIVGVDYSELTGLVKTTTQTRSALGLMAKEFANSGSQKAYMAGINKLVAAQNSLDKSARMSRSEIMKLGAQMKQEAQFANALARATTGLGGSLQQAGRRTNQLGVLMQQTGYQVGDFAVQVQSGTNIMVALGQQATQLVGTFGMLAKSTKMIGLFAGLGIAIPIITGIAGAYMRARKESDSFEKSTFDINEAAKNSTEELRKYREELALLSSQYKTLGEVGIEGQIKKVQGELEALSKRAKQVSASVAIGFGADAALADYTEQVGEALAENSRELNDQILAKRQQLRQLVLERESLERVKEVMGGINPLIKAGADAAMDRARVNRSTIIGMENQLRLSQEILKYGTDSVEVVKLRALQEGIAKNLTEENLQKYIALSVQVHEVEQATAGSATEAKNLADALKEAASAMSNLSSFGQGLDKAIAVAAAKVKALKEGANEAVAGRIAGLRADLEVKLSAKGLRPEAATDLRSEFGGKISTLERLLSEGAALKPSGRGGGSNTSEKNEKYLDNLLRETKLKAQLVGVSEQEAAKLKLLNTLEAKGIDLNDDRVKTLIEEQKNLAELEKAYEAQQEMVGMFKDTLTNALMSVIDGSRSVADAFKNMMRQILSSLAQKSIIQPLVSGLTGGLAGGAAGGLMGGLAAGTGIAATMGAIGTGLSTGFMTSVYGGLAGTAGAVSGGLSVAAGGGAAALGGAATAIGAIAAPLLAVAAVFSFFKKKVKELDSGISATVTNMDSYVESFSTIQTKKFWGLSKKVSTNTTAMDADNPISAAIASVQQSIFSTAQYLGIATDSLSAFSYEFKLSLKGLSEEAKMQKIAEEVNKLGDAFANLLPNVLNMEHLTAIMDERYSLETRLLEAQGNTEALRERELANTNEYNRAILEQIFAAEDAKAALDNLNNSLKETDFATLLDFNRAKAYARLGMNVANSPEVPSMSNTAASGVQAITNPMNTASGEIVQLRSEMKEMHKEAMFAYSKLIKNGKDSRDTLRSWDVVGLPAERTA